MRFEPYQDALKDDAAFLKQFMVSPLEVKDASGRKVVDTVTGDEGVFPTTKDGLAKLKPVLESGTVTFGGQTHPADGNAAVIVTTRERAKELSKDSGVTIHLASCGQARADKGFMPMANVPAARQALDIRVRQAGAHARNRYRSSVSASSPTN